MGKRQKIVSYPKAFACAMLKDGGRVLFLVQKERYGKKRLVLPSAKIILRQDPVSVLGSAFIEQTGIDGQIKEVIFEGRFNAGSRKYRKFIPLLVFGVSAKRMQAKVSPEFEGFRWLSIKDALMKEKRKEIFLEKWVLFLLREILRS